MVPAARDWLRSWLRTIQFRAAVTRRRAAPALGCLSTPVPRPADQLARAAFLAENLVERLHHGRGLGARKEIEHVLPGAARLHDLLAAQHREMLRQRRLAQADRALELADGFLAVGALAKDEQARRVRHRLEKA